MDAEAEAERDTFFFCQTNPHKPPKRYKKSPEELPAELRYANLNPKLAAYLANKEKEEREIPQEIYGDGLGNKSLLPQISQKVTTIRHHLDSALTQDEDSQRFLFEECKASAMPLLVQLGRILHYIQKKGKIQVPPTLATELQRSHHDLVSDVVLLSREWQLASKREEYYQAKLAAQAKAAEDELAANAAAAAAEAKAAEAANDGEAKLTSRSKDSDDAGKNITTPKESEGKGSRLGTKSSHLRPTGGLTDILEDEEGGGGKRVVSTTPRSPSVMVAPTATARGKGTDKKPKSRLQSRSESRHTLLLSSRKSHRGGDDSSSMITTSDSKSVMGNAGYWQVISFQLSNKSCEEKGWLVHQESTEAREREALLEYAIQRLQMAMSIKKQEETSDKARGISRLPCVVRYYGDGRRDATQAKYARQHGSDGTQQSVLDKNHMPKIPDTNTRDASNKKLLITSTSDGSTVVYYPSRRPALVASCTISSKLGFYTFAYEDSPEGTMMAAFTPTGRGACYHPNGVVRFLSTSDGGTLASEAGEITKRWSWPHSGSKLASTITFNLNRFITFKCLNMNQMTLVFNCDKETAKLSVGATSGAQEVTAKDDLGVLLSGLNFTSQAAKDSLKQMKPKHPPKHKHKMGGKRRARSPSLNPELQKLIDFPEPTENDEASDKHLYRLQRKVKNLVEDWLEHYRLSCGMKSPHLKTLDSRPARKHVRLIKSAKPPSQGGRAIIESIATSVPRVTVSPRIPSAPAGRKKEPLDFSEDDGAPSAPEGVSSSRPASATVTATVKFTTDPQAVPPHAIGGGEAGGGEHLDVPAYVYRAHQPRAHSSTVHGSVGILKNKGLTLPIITSSGPIVGLSDSEDLTSSSPLHRGDVQLRSGSGHYLTRSAPALNALANRLDVVASGPCPVALQHAMLGNERAACHCSRHKIPILNDLVYDRFIQHQAPPKQLIVVCVFSSLHADRTTGLQMLENLYFARNKNRTRPCLQSKSDPFRIFLYDVNTAADYTDFTQPLLLRRHNVLPGMFLMYEDRKLLFCDHIFNGYGNAKKDFHKQLMQTRNSARQGHHLPQDFRFSPQRGRSGQRSAWGGEIGGAGVDHHGGMGLKDEAYLNNKDSLLSLSSTDTTDNLLLDFPSGMSDIKLPYIPASSSSGPDSYRFYAKGGIAQHWPEVLPQS